MYADALYNSKKPNNDTRWLRATLYVFATDIATFIRSERKYLLYL